MALRHFAERGMAGATLRAIAAEAGVSPGLVQHHYGSKEGLRAACDAYVMETIHRDVRQAVDERGVEDPTFIEAAYTSAPLITRYLVRALLDGSPSAAALFDEIVRITEEHLAGAGAGPDGRADVRAHAAVFAAMKLGVGVFQDHLVRVLDVRDLVREGYPRIARAMLDIVSPSFVGPDLTAQARAGLDRYRRTASRSHGSTDEE